MIDKWDLIIAHPPCTKTSNAGAKHLWKGHKLNIPRYYEGLCGKALFMALLGLIIFLLGLYYKGITDFGIVEMKEPDKDAPERVKKTYEARQRVGNSVFPLLGGFVFVAFGLVMVLTRGNHWMWIFVGIGGLVIRG